MIAANKYIKMLGMNVDEVCKAIDRLSEKDAKNFMKMFFILQKYKVPFDEVLTESPKNKELMDAISKYVS